MACGCEGDRGAEADGRQTVRENEVLVEILKGNAAEKGGHGFSMREICLVSGGVKGI